MINIAIIGAGQIGSRHLQALAKLDYSKYNLYVVDVMKESLNVSQQRFNEVRTTEFNISFIQQISELPNNIEVCIVATSSGARKNITKELLSQKQVQYLVLEKFLFPDLKDYDEILSLLEKTNTKTFVNCARRMWTVYKDLKKVINSPVHFSAYGNNWGLASNGIHLLDLFSYLTNEEEINLENNLLSRKIIESKRQGYIEFTGTFYGQSELGSMFSVTSYDNVVSPITINISTPDSRIMVREEGNRIILLYSSISTNWKWEEKIYETQFQSQLSHYFVQDLVNNGTCDLVPYEISAKLHTAILKNLLGVVNEVNHSQITNCLIT
jgi:predicted dehydrogenase